MKVCFVNFTGFRENWGCQATSFELLKFISGCFEASQPPRFSFIPLLPRCHLDAEMDERLGEVHEAFAAIAGKTHKYQEVLDFLEQVCLKRYGFWSKEAQNADVIVFQAEGTMGGKEFRSGAGLVLLPFVAKHAWGKRVLSLNQTLFATDPDLITTLVHAFNSFDLVAVREGASVEFAREIGIDPCAYIPDCAFLTRPSADNRLPTLNSQNGYFCVTGSASKKASSHKHIFEIADRLRTETGLTPVLAASKDTKIIDSAKIHWPKNSYKVVSSNIYYPAVAHALNQCQFLVGGRYHMAIMAAAAGTPTLLLQGNTPKNEGLAAMLGSPLPIREFEDVEGVSTDARALMENLLGEKERLQRATNEIVEQLRHAQSFIKSILFSDAKAEYSCALPTIKITKDVNDYYSSFNKEKSSERKQKATSLDKILGSPPSLEEIVAPLLAGLEGDAHRTKATLTQILSSEDRPRTHLSKTLQRQLVEHSLLNRHKGVRSWIDDLTMRSKARPT